MEIGVSTKTVKIFLINDCIFFYNYKSSCLRLDCPIFKAIKASFSYQFIRIMILYISLLGFEINVLVCSAPLNPMIFKILIIINIRYIHCYQVDKHR